MGVGIVVTLYVMDKCSPLRYIWKTFSEAILVGVEELL